MPSHRELAHRPWTQRERRIVWRGLTGRFALAIEPLLGIVFMGFITWGIVWRAHHVASDATLIKIAPIFGLGALAFVGYFIAVLVAPFTAYLQTFKPIYVLDGYVRYREPDERSQSDACGYVAALFPDRSVAGEWEWLGKRHLPNVTIPSHVEFSLYAGIHAIDGKPTGLLPDEDLPLLAIGIARERFRD
ncbi:MAG TPA: hypothetical protein VIJ77_04420 [Candidatus Tumulicola sp.]|jgi:hypothetical protein